MDDFNVTSLHESKNEWGARLLTIVTPLVIEGFQSIYEEAYNLCKENNETDKHLMTFQNFLSRIPKWNANIIEAEQKRIIEKSACVYLEDLITCVHIIQLKLLTAVRVGNKQKKIDIKIPKLEDFIHKVYIIAARKIYKNVYLYERNISPLQVQKHNRELEILIQEAILNAVRESIPIDVILRSYLDETIEEDVQVEIHEEVIEPPIVDDVSSVGDSSKSSLGLSGGDSKNVDIETTPSREIASVNIESEIPVTEMASTSEDIHVTDSLPKQLEEERLIINNENVTLDHTDVHDLDPPSVEVLPDLLLDDVEVLV